MVIINIDKLKGELGLNGIPNFGVDSNGIISFNNATGEQQVQANIILNNVKYIRPLNFDTERQRIYMPLGTEFFQGDNWIHGLNEFIDSNFLITTKLEALIAEKFGLKALIPKNYGDKMLKVISGQNYLTHENAIIVYEITVITESDINFSYTIYDDNTYTESYTGNVLSTDTVENLLITDDDLNTVIQTYLLNQPAFISIFESHQVL